MRNGFWACLLILGGLTGCDPETTGTNVPVSSGSTTPVEGALRIADIQVAHKTLVGAEYLDVELVVEAPGTGRVTQYGLRTPYGEKTFPFKPALTVIQDGKVSLQKLGPPVVKKAGPMQVEFWLIDDAGNLSNTLSVELTVS